MSPSLIVFVLLIVAPLLVGASFLLARPLLHRPRVKFAAFTVGTCCLVGSIFSYLFTGPYLWALHLESKWKSAEPKTKIEMESFLSLYSQRVIDFETPSAGNDYSAKPGERMVRYLILGTEPLDVVYTSEDRLVATYTSYE